MSKELRAALHKADRRMREAGVSQATSALALAIVRDELALASDESGDEGLRRQREADAVVAAIEPLIIAFRRWCVRRNIEPPTTAEFRAILEESAEIRADLDHADEVGLDHASRPMLREVLH